MRFTSIFLAVGLALFATAETTSGNTPATHTDAASGPVDTAQAKILDCLHGCKDGDVACTSKCIAVPNPDESQVNSTNACVGACPQGNGSEAETKVYADCIQGCIRANYFDPVTGQPQPTAAATSGNTNNNNNGGGSATNSNGASGTGGSKASGTSAGAAATSSTGAAAGMIGVSGGLVGVVGFMAGVMAL